MTDEELAKELLVASEEFRGFVREWDDAPKSLKESALAVARRARELLKPHPHSRKVREFLAAPENTELAAVRADITRTALVVQAFCQVQTHTHEGLADIPAQYDRLRRLLSRERQLAATQPTPEADPSQAQLDVEVAEISEHRVAGYAAALRDVVAWLRIEERDSVADAIERGAANGAAKVGK